MSIKVEYAALERAAADIKQTVGFMETTLDDVKQDVERLCSTWEGEAQSAYRIQQDKWDKSAENLNTILAKIGTAVSAARERYQEGETGVKNLFPG